MVYLILQEKSNMHKRNAKEIDTPVATFLANTPFSLIIGLWVV